MNRPSFNRRSDFGLDFSSDEWGSEGDNALNTIVKAAEQASQGGGLLDGYEAEAIILKSLSPSRHIVWIPETVHAFRHNPIKLMELKNTLNDEVYEKYYGFYCEHWHGDESSVANLSENVAIKEKGTFSLFIDFFSSKASKMKQNEGLVVNVFCSGKGTPDKVTIISPVRNEAGKVLRVRTMKEYEEYIAKSRSLTQIKTKSKTKAPIKKQPAAKKRPVLKANVKNLPPGTSNPRKAIGYTNGNKKDIIVVTLQGKPVEIETARVLVRMIKDAKKEKINLQISSGFRTQAQQEYLYRCFRSGSCNNGNQAARPGYSKHQSGLAVDFRNCQKTSTKTYKWLNKNARAYDFKRTVASEPWHWVYLP